MSYRHVVRQNHVRRFDAQNTSEITMTTNAMVLLGCQWLMVNGSMISQCEGMCMCVCGDHQKLGTQRQSEMDTGCT